MHRGSHHLNLWVQGKFDSGVPGNLTLFVRFKLRIVHSLHDLMNKEARDTLRDSLRQTRHNITSEEQTKAAQHLCHVVVEQDIFIQATQIAFYLSFDGEIDPMPLMQKALTDGKSCYLPVISKDNSNQLSFAAFHRSTKLVTNKWGITEPPLPQIPVSPTSFDIVFVPLVGFDKNCFRLGMGKGLYDRTFGFKLANHNRLPLLVGLAHECQLTERIPTANWDVKLGAIITPEKIYHPDTT